MPKPSIELLGVYALPVTDELVRQQAEILYRADLKGRERKEAEQQAREQRTSTVLVEVLVRNRDKRFDRADFVQPRVRVPSDSWQTAWEETYLTVDGESRMEASRPDPPKAKDIRVA